MLLVSNLRILCLAIDCEDCLFFFLKVLCFTFKSVNQFELIFCKRYEVGVEVVSSIDVSWSNTVCWKICPPPLNCSCTFADHACVGSFLDSLCGSHIDLCICSLTCTTLFWLLLPYSKSGNRVYWILLYILFFWLYYMACGISVPQPGIEPRPQQKKSQFLGISHSYYSFKKRF